MVKHLDIPPRIPEEFINIPEMSSNLLEEIKDEDVLELDELKTQSRIPEKFSNIPELSSNLLEEIKDEDILELDEKEVEFIEEKFEEAKNKLNNLEQIISTYTELEKSDGEQILEHALQDVMKSLSELFHNSDMESESMRDNCVFLNDSMKNILKIKKESSEDISKVFSKIFYEFSDFIDDYYVASIIKNYKVHEKGYYVESVTQEVYGRTLEEQEDIKSKNRRNVVEKMRELNEKPYLSLEDIEELHRVNNRSIVPKMHSFMRKGTDGVVQFFKRIGIISPDVIPEMKLLKEKIERLIDERALGLSETEYAISVAKIHNDILEIHPFSDRNGSTSLLVTEALMMRVGYEPSEKREKDYYKHLRKILKNNPFAVSVVGYEQYKIAHHDGYYEGFTTELEGRSQVYETILQNIREKKK